MMKLTGLRNNNLQGYLAALGVVRLLPAARLGWDFEEGCAVLENVEDPVAALAAALKIKNPCGRLKWLTEKPDGKKRLKDLKKQEKAAKSGAASPSKEALDGLKAEIKRLETRHEAEAFEAHRQSRQPADWGRGPDELLWMRALRSPDGKASGLDLVTGMGRDETGLIAAMEKAREECRKAAAEKLKEALYGPWRHEDNVGALFWEYESLGYGPRHRGAVSPEHDRKRAVAAAQWLACEGLPVLGHVEGEALALPLWARPEPLPVVRERLKHRVGERWLSLEKLKLPGDNGRWYWTARTPSGAEIPGGSRKKKRPKYNDLYNGSEIWIA